MTPPIDLRKMAEEIVENMRTVPLGPQFGYRLKNEIEHALCQVAERAVEIARSYDDVALAIRKEFRLEEK